MAPPAAWPTTTNAGTGRWHAAGLRAASGLGTLGPRHTGGFGGATSGAEVIRRVFFVFGSPEPSWLAASRCVSGSDWTAGTPR